MISCDIGETFGDISKRILELAFTSASAAFLRLDENSAILLGFSIEKVRKFLLLLEDKCIGVFPLFSS